MAVEKQQALEFIDTVDTAFERIAGRLGPKRKEWIKGAIFGPALSELDDLIRHSRPPVIYVMGRSGHGKSSLINAMAGRPVAAVHSIEPQTPASTAYRIEFPETSSTWEVYDSRGIFEAVNPDGAIPVDTVDLLKNEVTRVKPDVILHVLAAGEVRACRKDLEVLKDIRHLMIRTWQVAAPTMLVISKSDLLGSPRQWPPSEYRQKVDLLQDLLRYASEKVLGVHTEPLCPSMPFKGVQCRPSHHATAAIIPVCTLETALWNIDVLLDFVGTVLPKSAQLNFYQAAKRKHLLRSIANSSIIRFSSIAAGIGTSPIPMSDVAVLTPLQMLMIALVGGLSCRSFSRDTALEFVSAGGITLGAGMGLRMFAQQVLKFVPFAGWAVSGAIAGAATYGIGKAAEEYFFSGEIVDPRDFRNEWSRIRKEGRNT